MLSLHAGAQAVTRERLAKVPVPASTRSWHPVPHIDVVKLVLDQLRGLKLTPTDEAHGIWREGQRYFGVFKFKTNEGGKAWSLAIGIRNSHDKSFPAQLAAGSHVFVCDNLAFSGEVTISRRHTVHILKDMPGLVAAALGRLGTLRTQQVNRLAAYQKATLEDRDAHDAVIQSMDLKVLGVTRLPLVLQEWREPKHEEFAPRTVWSLFNAFTEVMKYGIPLDEFPARTIKLHGLLDRFAGLPPVTIEEPSDN